jgi:hypothetical protein
MPEEARTIKMIHEKEDYNEGVEAIMTDKKETRKPDRVAYDYREEVPEFVVTRHELRQLARHWYDERLVQSFCFFIYQTTDSFEWRWSAYINHRLDRLTQVLGTNVMRELQGDAVKSFRNRCTEITDEDWRVFTTGTEDERQTWRVKVLFEDENAVVTAKEAKELNAEFGAQQANN